LCCSNQAKATDHFFAQFRRNPEKWGSNHITKRAAVRNRAAIALGYLQKEEDQKASDRQQKLTCSIKQ